MESGPCPAMPLANHRKSTAWQQVTGIREAPHPGLLPGIFLPWERMASANN